MDQEATTGPSRRTRRLAGTIVLSTSASLLVVLSSWMSETRLGAPLYWAWVLTGLQVIALWAAGRHQWWAWLLGAGVQPVWIVYAVLTGQLGFVPGCVISAAVQVRNFLRDPGRVVNSDHASPRPVAHCSGRRPRSCLVPSLPSRRRTPALVPEQVGAS